MEPESPPPPTEAQKLDAAIAALLAERVRRRREAGVPMKVTIVDRGRTVADLANDVKPLESGLHDEILIEVVHPEPIVEAPSTRWDNDHAGAVDVTPSPPRPPMPPPSPPPAPRDEPLTYSNNGIPRREMERELARVERFHSGEWSDPGSYPIRYPRGRGGW
jgi:hypothetical protein